MAVGKKKEISARLSLKGGQGFNKGMSDAQKQVIAFGAAATGITAGVAALTKSMANYQDATIKSARTAGIMAEEYSGLRHAAEQSGLQNEQFREIMGKLNDPLGEVTRRIKNVGISLNDNNGKTKTSAQLMGELADKVAATTDPAEKARIAVSALGEQGGKMVNFLNNGSAGLERLKKEAEELGITVSTLAGQQAEEFNDSLDSLEKSVKGVGNRFSETIIQMVNTSGVIKDLKSFITGITKAWTDLDQGTKETIITTAGITLAVVAAGGALAGLVALAPMVGAAVSTMLGPIGIGITLFTALAAGTVKYWDQVKGSLQPAIESITAGFESVKRVGQSVWDVIKDVTSGPLGELKKVGKEIGLIGEKSNDSQGEISILGTIVNVTMKAIGIAVIAGTFPFKVMVNVIGGVVKSIMLMASAARKVFTGDFSGAAADAARSWGSIRTMATNIKNDFIDAGSKIKQTFNTPWTVKVNADAIKKAKKEVEDLGNSSPVKINVEVKKVGDIEESWNKLKESAQTFDKVSSDAKSSMSDVLGAAKGVASAVAGVVKAVAGKVSIVVNAFSMLTQTMSDEIGHMMDVANRDHEVAMRKMEERHEEAAANLEKRLTNEIKILESHYNDQIEGLKSTENEKINILEHGRDMRIAMANEEFLAKKALADREFEEFMIAEQRRFEAEKMIKLNKTMHKEQSQIAEAMLNQSWKDFQEAQQAEHENRLREMATEHSNSITGIDESTNQQLDAQREASANTIKALEDKKNEHLLKANEAKDRQLKAQEEKALKEKESLEKRQAKMLWKAELQQFQQTKETRVAETLVNGISAAADAFAALAPIPWVGVPMGIAAAGSIMEATRRRVNLIHSQRPLKPAILMARGGLMPEGFLHSQGGIPAEVESGEIVIDRPRSNRILQAIENSTTNETTTQIIFERGSIVNDNGANNEAFAQRVADMLGRRFQLQGIYN